MKAAEAEEHTAQSGHKECGTEAETACGSASSAPPRGVAGKVANRDAPRLPIRWLPQPCAKKKKPVYEGTWPLLRPVRSSPLIVAWLINSLLLLLSFVALLYLVLVSAEEQIAAREMEAVRLATRPESLRDGWQRLASAPHACAL